MFGGRGFAGTYFAQAGGVPAPAPRTGGGVGGSGFPRDWLQRMFGGMIDPLITDADLREVEELVAIGLL